MKMGVIVRVMDAAGAAGVPVLLWGEPGTGKTSLIDLLADVRDAHVEVIVGSAADPADINGYPQPVDGKVEMLPRAFATRLNEATNAYLFMDELSTATPACQAGMLRVASEHQVGDLKLGRHVRIIAAANPTDQAADGWDLAPPMANRFMHIDFVPDYDDWLRGMTLGWDSLLPPMTAADIVAADPDRIINARAKVVGYIKHRPNALQQVPDDPAKAGKAWPSRRTWDYLARVMAHLPDDDSDLAYQCRRMAADGLVGEAAATEFLTWERSLDLPDPRKVIADPTSVNWKELRNDRLYAVLQAVASVVAADISAGAEDAHDVWQGGLAALTATAEAGKTDVASPFVMDLFSIRPKGLRKIPQHALRPFIGMLRDAGMMQIGS